jgi:acetyl esterase/lipase
MTSAPEDAAADPRITAREASDQAATRAAIPAAVLKEVFGGGGPGSSAPPATWEEMVERSRVSQQNQREALAAAGIKEQWEELQEGKWRGLIESLGDGLEITEHTCTGVDGNTIPLQLIRPPGGEQVPCAYYIHGGGMMMMSMRMGIFQAWGRLLARQGIACVLVDFRNSLQGHESVPEVAQFPAGLNDCFSGLEWVHANKAALNISDNICVTGDSGGGNLCIAVGMKALREHKLHLLPAGIFSMCPFIDGDHSPMGYSQAAYDRKDPLAWPSFAVSFHFHSTVLYEYCR